MCVRERECLCVHVCLAPALHPCWKAMGVVGGVSLSHSFGSFYLFSLHCLHDRVL